MKGSYIKKIRANERCYPPH